MLANSRPGVNSLLHLYGKWLFEAAYIGTEYVSTANGAAPSTTGSTSAQSSVTNIQAAATSPLPSKGKDKRPLSGADPNQLQPGHPQNVRRTSSSSQQSQSLTSSVTNESSLDLPAALTPDRFEAGRAEALGTLCRIFCSKKTGEEILPVYLARFYLAVQQGLVIGSDKIVSEVVAMVLVNCCDLFQQDLDGAHVLLPYLVTALEAVLPERELRLRPMSVQKTELRRAGINLLLSMLPLPSHFQDLVIHELVPGMKARKVMLYSME